LPGSSHMANIIAERMTAAIEDEVIVFLIGMRINRLWKVHKWWPIARAMPRMLRELAASPDSGFLGFSYVGWQSDPHASVLAFLRAFGALREGRGAVASAGVGVVQSRGRKQRRRRHLARNVSRKTRRFRMRLQQHAAVRFGEGDPMHSRDGTARISERADGGTRLAIAISAGNVHSKSIG
jgi:hypothetical protein